MEERSSLARPYALAAFKQAQEEKKLGWGDSAEVSFVTTNGNAEANTLGLRNVLTRTWDDALFSFEAAALRATTGTTSVSAIWRRPRVSGGAERQRGVQPGTRCF